MTKKIPGYQDYVEAIANPDKTLADPELKQGHAPAKITRGGRTQFQTYAGQFALTIRFAVGTKAWAIRCFMHDIEPDFEERYRHVTHFVDEVKNDYLVGIEFQPRGILIEGNWYPICKMEWVEGETLGRYVEANIKQPRRMATLPENFLVLALELEELGCAHGDLQHGNIMVERNQLRLVDYDGMYLPSYNGQNLSAVETGHRNYQHPKRAAAHFDATIDHFSAISIYLSLRALQKDNNLFQEGGEALFLKQSDYLAPHDSPNIAKLNDLGYQQAAERLRQLCELDVSEVPTLRQFIREDATLLNELPEVLQKEVQGEAVIRSVTNPPPAPEKPVVTTVQVTPPPPAASAPAKEGSQPPSQPASRPSDPFKLPDDVISPPPAKANTPAAPVSSTPPATTRSVSKPVIAPASTFKQLGDDDVIVTPPTPPAPKPTPPAPVAKTQPPPAAPSPAPARPVAPSMSLFERVVRLFFVALGAGVGLVGYGILGNMPVRRLRIEPIYVITDYISDIMGQGVLIPYLGLAIILLAGLHFLHRRLDDNPERPRLLALFLLVGFTLFSLMFVFTPVRWWPGPLEGLGWAAGDPGAALSFAILGAAFVVPTLLIRERLLLRLAVTLVAVTLSSAAFPWLRDQSWMQHATLGLGIGVIPWIPDLLIGLATAGTAASGSRNRAGLSLGKVARGALVLGLMGGGILLVASNNTNGNDNNRGGFITDLEDAEEAEEVIEEIIPSRTPSPRPSETPVPSRTPTPRQAGNSRPRITDLDVVGTCESFELEITASDADSDIRRVEQISNSSTEVLATAQVNRGTGSFTWSGWSCSSSSQCRVRVRVVDSRSNRSDIVDDLIVCDSPTATPTPRTGVVTGSQRINLRSGPGTDFGIIGGLEPRTQVTILATSDDRQWYRVRGNGRVGWVARSLIR